MRLRCTDSPNIGFNVALTSANLVGFLRAEFDKSSKLRVALFFLQLLVAIPAAVSVVIPDNYHRTLYALAILGWPPARSLVGS